MLPISFLSDYGRADLWVGVCHGVIQQRAPGAIVVDVTHEIPAHDIAAGALALRGAVPFLPHGVHLAVVDPGVGTPRRAVAMRCADANLMVGPDNGLLWPAAVACGGVADAWDIGESPHRIAPVSATFHGRDLFAPVAAALARGGSPDPPGRPLDPRDLTHLELPAPVVEGAAVTAAVVAVDRFGNLQLELGREGLAAAGIEAGRSVRVVIDARAAQAPAPGKEIRALFGRTFADAGGGEMLVYVDSSGLVALALDRASAAAELGAGRGTRIRLEPWD